MNKALGMGTATTLVRHELMDEHPNDTTAVDREALERASEVTFFIASGPGGQHRNRNATGVRLLHRPSGIVVTATERRSQAANLKVAYERLTRRLEAATAVVVPRVATRPSRTARAKRLGTKRRRSATKAFRGPVSSE